MGMIVTQFLYLGYFRFFFLSHPEAKIPMLEDFNILRHSFLWKHDMCTPIWESQPGDAWFILVSAYVLLPSITEPCNKQIAECSSSASGFAVVCFHAKTPKLFSFAIFTWSFTKWKISFLEDKVKLWRCCESQNTEEVFPFITVKSAKQLGHLSQS